MLDFIYTVVLNIKFCQNKRANSIKHSFKNKFKFCMLPTNTFSAFLQNHMNQDSN
ncbi:unnamed protein product [Moneuplotes crassus]|uniref:Uncharacterized protein n=1 Tax=Euplotes crassus TaxID=5936 RepID=A0AAD2D9H2_EUPCR|nr:unnamed protein product [Moneuplotes crassus]